MPICWKGEVSHKGSRQNIRNALSGVLCNMYSNSCSEYLVESVFGELLFPFCGVFRDFLRSRSNIWAVG